MIKPKKTAAAKQPPDPQEGQAEPHKLGYARVSTADQNPQFQVEELIKAGVNRLDIYVENAGGGAGAKRPQFEALMKEATEGDLIIVWKLDRLGRSTRQVLDTFHELDRRGVKVKVLTQPLLDTSTPMGWLFITIMAAVAEMEHSLAKERSKAGLEAARARGAIGGRKFRVSEAQIIEARHLGTKAGAKKVGLTPAQFARRVERLRMQEAKAEQAKKAQNDQQT